MTARGVSSALAVLPASPAMWRLGVNFAAFQAAWFVCVLAAARAEPWFGVAAAAVAVGAHLLLCSRRTRELALVTAAITFGFVWDSAVASTGWIAYASGALSPGLAPSWILALWALFATTLNVSLRWLRGRWILAAVFGALAGPLSYVAGERLGALVLVAPMPALITLAAGWAVITPLLIALARRWDGVSPPAR